MGFKFIFMVYIFLENSRAAPLASFNWSVTKELCNFIAKLKYEIKDYLMPFLYKTGNLELKLKKKKNECQKEFQDS